MRTLILFVAFTSLLGCGQTSPSGKEGNPGKEGDPVKPARAELGKPEFTLTSRVFVEEFKKDRKVAHAKYKGKTVELTGLVTSIGANGSGEPLVMLQGVPMKFKWALCFTVARYPGTLLAPGQTATIKGRGHDSFPDAILLDCEVVKAEGPKPTEMTADELSQVVAKDFDAATKKYSDKWIRLSGEVKKVKFNEVKAATVVMKTRDKGPRVEALFTSNDKEALQKVKPGQKLEVLGQFSLLTVSKDRAGLFSCVLLGAPK